MSSRSMGTIEYTDLEPVAIWLTERLLLLSRVSAVRRWYSRRSHFTQWSFSFPGLILNKLKRTKRQTGSVLHFESWIGQRTMLIFKTITTLALRNTVASCYVYSEEMLPGTRRAPHNSLKFHVFQCVSFHKISCHSTSVLTLHVFMKFR